MQTSSNPLRLDFETGDLSFWVAEGEAFQDQPVYGDVVKASRIKPDLVPLGGDYWDGPYPVGHQGNYWIHTRDDLTGTLTSDEFTIEAGYPWFSFLIGGGDDLDHLRVEFLIKIRPEQRQKFGFYSVSEQEQQAYPVISLGEKGEFYRIFAATGHNSEVLRRVVLDTTPLQLGGERARIRIVDTATSGHISVDDFRFSVDCPQVTPLQEGGGDPTAPVWGMADLHTHPMAALAFAAIPFWGQPDGPIEEALASCNAVHGRGILRGGIHQLKAAYFEESGKKKKWWEWLWPGHAGGGYPYFDGWPKFTTTIHQQMYIDWIKRAYEGGLRLLVAHAVNNELLAREFATKAQAPYDDWHAVAVQVDALKALVQRHADWMEIAYAPAEARRIIRQNKLAIVLGMELDTPGNWRHEDECSDDDVRAYVHHLYYDLGIRHCFTVHLANNAFGGTALYMDIFNPLNHFLQGSYFQVEDGSQDGVNFRLGEDPGPALRLYQLLSRIPWPGVKTPSVLPDYSSVPGGHINVQGLTARGQTFIEEMMCLGMLIDLDHMSHKTLGATLDLAEQRDYPVISGHCWFQALSWGSDETADIHKRSHELQRTPLQLERIRQLGGMIAPILNQGDIRAVTAALPGLPKKVPADSAGTAKSWAQAYLYALEKMGGKGIGIGTDMHGLAKSIAPRFGFDASYYLHYHGSTMGPDEQRLPLRKAQVEAQTNGVRYNEPLKDIRPSRFTGVLSGEIYHKVEHDIMLAIALYHAGHRCWTGCRRSGKSSQRVENFVKGFCASTEVQLLRPGRFRIGKKRSLWEQRAAFLAKAGIAPGETEPAMVHRLYKKIVALWQKWIDMQGTNRPLSRSRAGEHDFDINLDGVAHYGMLPDFLQDLKNVGLTHEDLMPLLRSAECYIQIWEKCDHRSRTRS